MKNKNLSSYFQLLDQLQHIIFSCYIKRDYLSKRYQYEERIHQVRNKLFHLMQKIRASASENKILPQLEHIYEIIFSLSLLKLRVPDHATFEVCEQEMKLLQSAISAVLVSASANQDLIERLSGAINSFEEVYRSTLQIVSYEPVVFLFFLQDLGALRDELQSLLQELAHA